jgi:hypothetical protein
VKEKRSANMEQGCVRKAFAIRAKRPCDLRIVCACPREGGCHPHSATISSIPKPCLTCRGPCGVSGATVAAAPPVTTSPVSSPVQAVHFVFLASHKETTLEWETQLDVATPGASTLRPLQALQL